MQNKSIKCLKYMFINIKKDEAQRAFSQKLLLHSSIYIKLTGNANTELYVHGQ